MAKNFDWSQFEEAKPNAKAQAAPAANDDSKKSFDWTQFDEVKQPQKATTAQNIKEALLGAPANILQGIAEGTRGVVNTGANLVGLPNVPQGESVRDMLGLPAPTLADKFVEGAGSIAPIAVGGEAAGVPAIAGNTLKGIASRGAVEGAAYGGTQNQQNPILGTILGALLGSGSSAAASAIPALLSKPVQVAQKPILNYIAKIAGSTDSAGNRLYPNARTPQEAQKLMQNVGNFPTTLGQVSGVPAVQAVEKYSGMVPFSGASKQELSAIAQTDNYSQQLINKLSGSAKPEDIPVDIANGVRQAEIDVKNQMNDKYSPIEAQAEAAGLRIKERPNLQKTVDYYLNGNAEKTFKGTQPPKPDLNNTETEYLQNIANPPVAASGNASDADFPSFAEMREFESKLKATARAQGAAGNRDKQQMYNDLADATRQDYDHNANLINAPGIKGQLDSANDFAKNNYYNVFNKPDIEKILDGTHNSNTLYNTLVKPENAQLLASMPQDVKYKIFLNGMKNNLKSGENDNIEVSPANLAKAYAQAGGEKALSKQALLDPDTQQQFKNLMDMQNLVKSYRVSGADVATGKRAEPYLQAGALYTAAHTSLPATLAGLVSNRVLNSYLRNPATIQSYINAGKTQALSPSLLAALAGKTAALPLISARPAGSQ